MARGSPSVVPGQALSRDGWIDLVWSNAVDIVFQFVDVKFDGTFMLGIATRSFFMPNLEQGFLFLVWWRGMDHAAVAQLTPWTWMVMALSDDWHVICFQAFWIWSFFWVDDMYKASDGKRSSSYRTVAAWQIPATESWTNRGWDFRLQ